MNAPLSPQVSLPRETRSLSRTERREYLVGVIAAASLVATLVLTALANRGDHPATAGGLTLTASFTRVDGIHVGSPVRIAGINVGTISAVDLNDERNAVLTFNLAQSVALPDDTAAVIETDGIFGTKYVELRPGGTDDMLKSGARISYTQSAVIIEDLIALIVQRAKDARADNKSTATDTPPANTKQQAP